MACTGVLLDAATTYTHVVENMHAWMIPFYGGGILLIFTVLVVYFALKPATFAGYFPFAFLVFSVAEVVRGGANALLLYLEMPDRFYARCIAFVFLISSNWVYATVIAPVGMLGVFAHYSNKEEYYKLHTLFSVVLFFAFLGFFKYLGFTNIYDAFDEGAAGSAHTNCVDFYGLECDCAEQCYGWVSFLRFLAFSLIIIQGAVAFVGYIMVKESEDGLASKGASYSQAHYESIGDDYSSGE